MASAITISVLVYLVSFSNTVDAGSKSCKTGSDTVPVKLHGVTVGDAYAKVQVCQQNGKVVTGGVSGYGFNRIDRWFFKSWSTGNSGFSDKGIVSKNGFKVLKATYKRDIRICVGFNENWLKFLELDPIPFKNRNEFIVWLAKMGVDFVPTGLKEKCGDYRVTHESYSYPSGETEVENVKIEKIK